MLQVHRGAPAIGTIIRVPEVKIGTAALLALAATTASSLSDESLREIARSTPKPLPAGAKFVVCAVCGCGGGTLVNDGSKARKIHRPACQ